MMIAMAWRRSAALLAMLLLLTAASACSAQTPPSAFGSPDEANTVHIFRQTAPAVVFITNRQPVRQPFSTRMVELPVGNGTGFIINPEGLILTNAHVVEGASSLLVKVRDVGEFPAEVEGVAPEKDVALIRIAVPGNVRLPVVEAGDSDALVVGQKVLAIGNPFGLDHTLTTGVISALNREVPSPVGRPIRGVIQTDAAINPGNSGGPLLDSQGRVIGMNSSILSPGEGNIGIGFAVPVNTILHVLPQLAAFGQQVRPVLGIAVAGPEFAGTLGIRGVVVLEVYPGSGAATAGMTGLVREPDGSIILGDVIQAVEGRPTADQNDLLDILERQEPGDVVTVLATKRGERREYRVTLSVPAPQ